jgi:thiol-disulfide isomerase/thioredoxin
MSIVRHTLAIVAALVVVGCGASARPQPSTPHPGAEIVLRQSLATVADGEPTTLKAVSAGRPMLVNLWATWCDSCKKDLPALGRLVAKAQARGAVVAMVAVGEPRATVSSFSAREQIAGELLVDEEFTFADALGTREIPTTLVFDREGRLVYQGGRLDRGALNALAQASGDAPPKSFANTR